MIVELTGCSGVGKTTLLEQMVVECRRRNLPVLTVPQALLKPLAPSVARHPIVQNLLFDAAAALRRLLDRARYRAFLTFARSVIRRESDQWLTGMNAYRGVIRAVGVYTGLRDRCGRAPVVLVDEGTVHQAHNVLVHVTRPARSEDIRRFAELVPLPDMIVHVTAPLDAVLARTTTRHRPPLRLRSLEDNTRYVRHGYAMFAELMRHEPFTRNVVRVCCDDDDWRQYGRRAREIIERIA
jgi:thymidylate kinase